MEGPRSGVMLVTAGRASSWPADWLRAHRDRLLRRVIWHAHLYVPYYRDLFDRCGAVVSEITPDPSGKVRMYCPLPRASSFASAMESPTPAHGTGEGSTDG